MSTLYSKLSTFSNCALQRKFHLCILCVPRKGIVWSQFQFPHSCACERFIYSQDRPTYFPAAEKTDQSWEYINRSPTHECGRAFPFVGIFVSNFRYCVFAVLGSNFFVCSKSFETVPVKTVHYLTKTSVCLYTRMYDNEKDFMDIMEPLFRQIF
jgi:hypothetical protein